MAHQLLSELDTEGVISRHLQPLLERIHQMLGGAEADATALMRRVRIISPAKRPVPGPFFERVAEALLKRRRLHMRYLTRAGARSASATCRRSAWCTTAAPGTWTPGATARERLLRFALDAIEVAQVLDTKAGDAHAPGAGRDGRRLRHLRRRPRRAGRCCASTPRPRSGPAASSGTRSSRAAGWRGRRRYELRVPYVDETEIVMDVLRQGPEVQVLAPPSLRAPRQGPARILPAPPVKRVSGLRRSAAWRRAWRVCKPEGWRGAAAGI
jgi:predicted DNA-binding transcriptional regulator YafY